MNFPSRVCNKKDSTGNSAALCVVLLLIFLLAGCSQPGTGQQPRAGQNRLNLDLPTAQPTVAPSPSSTRVLSVALLTPAPTPTITPIPDEALGLVVDVIDGDTIAVVMDGDPMRLAYQVRYLGIDAPVNSPDEPWGVVAYETNMLLSKLKVVRLVRDTTDFDDDGYLLRYVYVGDQLLNTQLVAQGLAGAAIDKENSKLEDEIKKAEADAKKQSLGLWSGKPPTATPPTLPNPAEEDEEEEAVATPDITVKSVATLAATGTITATLEPAPATTAAITPTETTAPTPTLTSTPENTPEPGTELQGPSSQN